MRKLNTGDQYDTEFKLNTKSPISFAYTMRGTGDFKMSHTATDGNTALGGVSRLWVTADEQSGAITMIYKSNPTKTAHGWVEYTAWGCLIFLNFISGRYFKNRWLIMPIIHWITGAIIFGLSIWGFWLYFERKYAIYNDIHSIMGFVLTIIVILQSIGGTIQLLALRSATMDKGIVVRMKWLHQVTGYFLALLGFAVMYLGLINYQANWVGLFTIQLAISFVLLVSLEIWHRFANHKMINSHKFAKSLPDMSIMEYESKVKSGSLIVTFDNLVLDVSKYQYEHPGGASLLALNIGRDVGCYFVGSFTQNPSYHTVVHSTWAFDACKDIAIAKIPFGPYLKYQFESDFENWTLISKQNITDTVARFTFMNPRLKINPLDDGIESVGRHFLIKSMTTGVARYYTVCNSLSKAQWKYYKRCIDADTVRASKRTSLNEDDDSA